MSDRRPDLLVVGAGPAGLAVAIAARRVGLAVRVVDRAPGPPIDKACGEGLMPDGVAALERLGVDVQALRGAPFRGIRYVDGAVAAEADFPGRPGLGVRRTRLHAALVERAGAAGVEVEWGVRVVGIEGEAPEGGGRRRRERSTRWRVRTSEGTVLEAAAVVGADGLRSRMRRWAGLAADDGGGDGEEPANGGRVGRLTDSIATLTDDRRETPSEPTAADRPRPADPILAAPDRVPRETGEGTADGVGHSTPPTLLSTNLSPRDSARAPQHLANPVPAPAADPAARFGVRRHYRVPAAELPPRVEVWWGDRCEAYVTPVGPEEVGVAMLWSGRKAGFDALLAGLPALARRFVGRPVVSDDRGAGPLLQPARAVVRGNLALVGDAGGYVDAITGEGLSLAFHQAEALVAAVAAGDLAAYARAHRRLGRVPNALARLLVAVERRPALRRRAVRALAADPALFAQLLAVHARERRATAFFPAGAARLAWRLATAAE